MKTTFFIPLLFACMTNPFTSTAQCSFALGLYGSNSVCVAGATKQYSFEILCGYDFELTVTNGTFVNPWPVGAYICGGIITYSDPTRIKGIGAMNCWNDPKFINVTWSASGGTILLKSREQTSNGSYWRSKSITVPNPASIATTGASGPVCQTTTSLNYSVNTATLGGNPVWSTTSSGAPPLTISCPTCANVTITGFQPFKAYYITCKVYCGSTQIAQRTKQIFTGANCAGDMSGDRSEEMEESDWTATEIEVFPNPVAQGEPLVVDLPVEDGLNYQVRIIDLTGKMIYNDNLEGGNHALDLGILPAGAYTVQVNYSGNSVSRLFIVN